MGNLEKIETLKDDLDFARESGDAKAEAEALYGIARIYFKDKVYEAADDFWTQCYKVCRENDMPRALIQVLLDLTDTALNQNDGETALKRVMEAETEAREKNLVQELARTLTKKGDLLIQAKKMDAAVVALEEGLSLCGKSEDRIGCLFFLDQLIPIYKLKEDSEKIESSYRDLITFSEKLGDRERMALGLTGFGDWMRKTKGDKEASPYLALAHDLFVKIGRHSEAELVRKELGKMGVFPKDID